MKRGPQRDVDLTPTLNHVDTALLTRRIRKTATQIVNCTVRSQKQTVLSVEKRERDQRVMRDLVTGSVRIGPVVETENARIDQEVGRENVRTDQETGQETGRGVGIARGSTDQEVKRDAELEMRDAELETVEMRDAEIGPLVVLIVRGEIDPTVETTKNDINIDQQAEIVNTNTDHAVETRTGNAVGTAVKTGVAVIGPDHHVTRNETAVNLKNVTDPVVVTLKNRGRVAEHRLSLLTRVTSQSNRRDVVEIRASLSLIRRVKSPHEETNTPNDPNVIKTTVTVNPPNTAVNKARLVLIINPHPAVNTLPVNPRLVSQLSNLHRVMPSHHPAQRLNQAAVRNPLSLSRSQVVIAMTRRVMVVVNNWELTVGKDKACLIQQIW